MTDFDPSRYADDTAHEEWIDYRRLDPGGEGVLVIAETPDGELNGCRVEDNLYLGDPLVIDGDSYLVSQVRWAGRGTGTECQRVTLSTER